MMPVERRKAPRDLARRTSVEDYQRRAQKDGVEAAWKAFRASPGGKVWFEALQTAYGHRCLYCDHSPGRTIDHVLAKSASLAETFAWRNHRPSCGDCNRLKGKRPFVDPVAKDPRAFIVFDVATGKPAMSQTITPRQKRKAEKAEHARRALDQQTLNDARRAMRQHLLSILVRFLDGERGVGSREVLAALADGEPHRAILRDLILEEHAWSPLVRKATRRIPSLRTWAEAPLR
jgi:hypothetical protein